MNVPTRYTNCGDLSVHHIPPSNALVFIEFQRNYQDCDIFTVHAPVFINFQRNYIKNGVIVTITWLIAHICGIQRLQAIEPQATRPLLHLWPNRSASRLPSTVVRPEWLWLRLRICVIVYHWLFCRFAESRYSSRMCDASWLNVFLRRLQFHFDCIHEFRVHRAGVVCVAFTDV